MQPALLNVKHTHMEVYQQSLGVVALQYEKKKSQENEEEKAVVIYQSGKGHKTISKAQTHFPSRPYHLALPLCFTRSRLEVRCPDFC